MACSSSPSASPTNSASRAKKPCSAACKNYLDGHPEPQLAQQDGVTTVRTHDNYDATLLLDDAFWEKLQPTLPRRAAGLCPDA